MLLIALRGNSNSAQAWLHSFFKSPIWQTVKKNSGSSILQLGQFQTVSNCPVTGVCHRVLSGFTEAECCYSPVDLSSFFWRIALLRNANFFRASSSEGELGFQLCLALSLICESLISLYSVITKKTLLWSFSLLCFPEWKEPLKFCDNYSCGWHFFKSCVHTTQVKKYKAVKQHCMHFFLLRVT